MKKIKLLSVIFVFVVFSGNTFGQKIKVTKGDLNFLKGVKELKLQYSYDNMNVGKYSEEDYIAKKKSEYNKSEDGRGDKWEKMWIEDRETKFEPKFEELFVKYISNGADADASQHADAEYTMILHTYFTEPGYNIGISSAPASINCEVIFVKTSNPDEIIATIDIKKSPGRSSTGAGWDTGGRIKEAYAKAGKELSKFLLKNKAF